MAIIDLAGLIALTVPAHAASGNSAVRSGAATATAVRPITLTHAAGRALVFGRFTRGAGGTVVVTAAGAASTTGDVAFVPGSSTATDRFRVTGDANRAFSIATAAGMLTAGAATLSFTTTASATSLTLNGSGRRNFTVGGTLTVPATATPGSYAGSYNVTVAYN